MARAFLRSYLLWSMSSISCSFCIKLGVRKDVRPGAGPPETAPVDLHFSSRLAPPHTHIPSAFPGASPTWEISARMIPRYCLPCPRASMSARNSLSSPEFPSPLHRERAIRVQESRGPPRSRGGGVAGCLPGMGKQFCVRFSLDGPQEPPSPAPRTLPHTLRLPLPSITGPSGAHILQCCPA